MRSLLIITAAAALILQGCTGTKPESSGALSDGDALTPSDLDRGTLVYRAPDLEVASTTRDSISMTSRSIAAPMPTSET